MKPALHRPEHIAQFHDATGAGQDIGRNWRGQKALIDHTVGFVALYRDRDRVPAFSAVGIANGHARIQDAKRGEHILFLHPEELELVGRDSGSQTPRLHAETVVHVHNKGHAFKRLSNS